MMSEAARQAMLVRLGPLLGSFVLVGGQAVSVWAAVFGARSVGLRVLASKDVDFATGSPEGSAPGGLRAVIEQVRAALGGRAFFATLDDHTVSFAKVVFIDADGAERAIDFLGAPFGLTRAELIKHCLPVRIGPADTGVELYVMNPVHSMVSRTCNVVSLSGQYHTPRGLEQLRASILSARGYLESLLDAGAPTERASVREVLRWNERIAEFMSENLVGRSVVAKTGLDPFDAVVVDARLGEMFVTRRYPAMRARVLARRR